MFQLQSMLKTTFKKSGSKIFPRRSGKKVAASFGVRRTEFGERNQNTVWRLKKPQNKQTNQKADGCATWNERQFGQTASCAATMRQNPSSEQAGVRRRKAKVIKQSEDLIETGENASHFGFPPLQHCFQKCNVSSVCVGNVAVRPPPPPPAPSSVIGRKER